MEKYNIVIIHNLMERRKSVYAYFKKKRNATRKNKNIIYRNYGKNKDLIDFEKEIVLKFIEILNTVKIYHWKTYSYATHKATDELYSQLNENIDRFMEVLLGKQGDRINLANVKTIPFKDFISLEQMKREIDNFKSYLVELNENKGMKAMSNYDLFTIRDEILANLNQFLYLTTFQ